MVSVLFCDVVGSTALGESTDAEALRGLLARYFERMRVIVERHGGSVEKFIGDAVMAVFGVPAVHEDDALRACRAAVEMREAFPGLGIEGRIGVCTGEVVAGSEERLATGDALNVAARLQQAAAPGEVLIAAATRALVAGAVEVEPVAPLELKGKSRPVQAFRLLSARAAVERRHDMRFVGRERELALIAEAWGRTLADRRCELVTIVGDAGLGKSRLTAEALGSIDARILRGRCLPYGVGITYWPVVEVVKQLGALPSDPAAAAAIRSLLGESAAGTSAEEIAWAFRKLLEEQAPLVVVFDDIQWGEETFLDLVEHVALLSSGAPILLLCMARPELLDARPSWPVAVRLEPLGVGDAARLIGSAPEAVRARIAACRRRQPALHRRDAGDGRRGGRRDRGAADVEGAAGGPPRPARRGRAAGARAGRGRGRGLPPRRRAGARPGGDPGHAAAGGARAPGADPPRRGAVRARGRLPLPAPADPRRRLRGAPEGLRADLHELLRRTGSKSAERIWSSWTRSSATTSSRPPATGASSDSRDQRRCGASGSPARGRRPTRSLARRRPGRRRAARAGAAADAAGAPGRRARARPRPGALRKSPGGRQQRSPTAAAERARSAGDETAEALARVGATYYRTFFADDPAIDELETRARRALPLLEQAERPRRARARLGCAQVRSPQLALPLRGLRARVGAGAPSRPVGRPAQIRSLPARPRARLRPAARGRGPTKIDALLPENPHPSCC